MTTHQLEEHELCRALYKAFLFGMRLSDYMEKMGTPPEGMIDVLIEIAQEETTLLSSPAEMSTRPEEIEKLSEGIGELIKTDRALADFILRGMRRPRE